MTRLFFAVLLFLSSISAHAASLLTSRESRSVLREHNIYRSQVQMPALKYGRAEADSALKWAQDLESRNCPLEHSSAQFRSWYGENLYAQWSSWLDLSVSSAVRAWGSEKVDYDAKSNSCALGKVCGHYTQIVWRATTQVGCARAKCSSSGQQTEILVCQYNPAGNYQGIAPY